MNKDREYLERNYMQLKRMRRELIMMTIGILDGEDYYETAAKAIPHIEKAIDLMKLKLEEG
jgi:hypothetical protein|tara:strand:+ start:473 stop:655 length:183 start_codon:yes stop_codon:yes gene_type:complete